MTKIAFAALFGVLLGCRQAPSFQAYRETTGEFTLEAPAGWGRDYDDAFSRKPIASVSWIGELIEGGEGQTIGTVIQVRKLWRLEKDHPNPKEFGRYSKNVLEPTSALFEGTSPKDVTVSKRTVDGREARGFQRDLVQTTGGGLHGAVKKYPSKVEGIAIETPSAYYILEYRATKEKYDALHPAFEHLVATFKLNTR